jgi:hypothetical protein
MSTVNPLELLQLYAREEITDEQALGHIIQNLVQMYKSQQALNKEIERLKAFMGLEQKTDEEEA